MQTWRLEINCRECITSSGIASSTWSKALNIASLIRSLWSPLMRLAEHPCGTIAIWISDTKETVSSNFALFIGLALLSGVLPSHQFLFTGPVLWHPPFPIFFCDPGVLVADFLPCNIPASGIEGRRSDVTDVELYPVSFRSFLLAAPESFFCLGLFLEVKSPPSLGILV